MKWNRVFLALATAATSAAAAQPLPEVAVGRVERLPALQSRHVDARPVDVWLPADYSPDKRLDKRRDKRYQVLHIHDGQMLFDAGKSWNQQAWNVHLAVNRLVQQGRIPDTLVLGVWNNGARRHSEYYPAAFLPFVGAADQLHDLFRGQPDVLRPGPPGLRARGAGVRC